MTGLKPNPSLAVKSTDRRGNRLDIQGLRGIAILVGVPFHAGLPVPGGFVALDMFFVISGFVITGMIHRERSTTGHLRVGQFYLRRFKRLTPALALTVGVTMFLSFFLLSPFGVQQVAAETGLAAMLLGANFAISGNTGDYFGVPAKSNPLLHTWSLSVEEQFYLVFPAMLLLGWMLSRHWRRIPWPTVLVAAAAFASLWFAMIGTPALGPLAPFAKYLTGYYGPLSRSWEFAAGALLFLVTRNPAVSSAKLVRLLAWPGFVLLSCSPWVINTSMRFPGPWTLLPVTAILLIIAAGTHNSTWVNRFLALPLFVKFGDWSYSIYLWHWPLIVFATTLWPQTSFAAPLAAALSILPALASYQWVEVPLRDLRSLSGARNFALIGAVVSPAIILAVTVGLAADHYWLPRYRSGDLAIAHQGAVDDWGEYFVQLKETYYPCTDQAIRDNALDWHGATRCRQSKPGSRIDVAVIGDSHAEQLFIGLAIVAPNKNIVYYIQNGGPVRSTIGMNRIIDHVASDPAIQTVIVNAGWSSRGIKQDELVETFQAFRFRGKAVFTTDDMPGFDFDAAACKYRMAPVLPFAKCTEDRSIFDAQYAMYYEKLKAATARVSGVRLLNTASYFCSDRVCSMNSGKALLYRDHNHLNDTGSRFLVNRMVDEFPEFRAALTKP